VRIKLVGILALIAMVFSFLWVVMMIWGTVRGGMVETFDQALEHVRNRDWLYVLTYANAVLITVSVTALFGALYAYLRPAAPAWSAVGIVFVPVYSAFNLFVYASQITIVPQLARLQSQPDTDGAGAFFLGQMIQAWPGSAMGIVNGLAYAVLGIPSLIFGLLLCGGSSLMRVAGVLLILNGIACFAGPLGLITGIPVLELGTVVGGLLFLMSLVPLSVAFLRMDVEWTR
jgi:hypothetical protein